MLLSDFYSYCQFLLYLLLELLLVRFIMARYDIDTRYVKRTSDKCYRWAVSFF